MNPSVRMTNELVQQDLIDLLHGKILALRIPTFESESICKKWQEKLSLNGRLNRYSNALDVPVNRIGMTLFETENKPEKIIQYLKEGQKTRSTIRKIFGRINPLEQIFKKLSSGWTSGYEIQKMAEKCMNPGIIRSFESSAKGGLPPHVDSLLKDLPDSDEFSDMKVQLAANLYFDVSETGGELELWDYAPTSSELEELYTGDYDFIDKEKIPVNPCRLQPQKGELILFRSNCIHSVTNSQGGTRSAASCFIGYYDENKPLTVWA